MQDKIRNIFMCFPEGKRKSVTLSYDDGVIQDIRMCDIMTKYGIAGTFNVNSFNFLCDTQLTAEKSARISLADAPAVYKEPLFEVATHGFSHPFLTKIPQISVIREIMEDRKVIEDGIGVICRGHAYPYGAYDDKVLEALRLCGIVYARTTHSTRAFGLPKDWLMWHPTCHHNDAALFELLDKFINEQPGLDPWVFYLWGHTYEFDNGNNWDRIEAFCEKISQNKEVWFATNIQIYEYVTAFRSLVYSADGRRVYNPSAQDVWLSVNSETTYKVPAGRSIYLA